MQEHAHAAANNELNARNDRRQFRNSKLGQVNIQNLDKRAWLLLL